MLSMLSSGQVFIHSPSHEKRAVIGIPSPELKLQIIKQNSPGLLLVWTSPVVSDKPWNVIVGGGGVNLYFYRLGTATSMLSMEDIDN